MSGPHITSPVRRLGVHKELGGETAGTADPSGIPDYTMSCLAHKAVGRRASL